MNTPEQVPTIGMDNAQRLVGTWGDRTFPQSTKQTIAAHLLREVVALYMTAHGAEFREDWETAQFDLYTNIEREVAKAWERTVDSAEKDEDYLSDPQRLPTEAADVLMLLYHTAHRAGFSLSAYGARKFAEIQGWDWGTPDEYGVIERKEETDGEA